MSKVQRVATGQSYMQPIAYEQITGLNSAKGLTTIPNGCTLAMIQPESQNVRWRDDQSNPTASVGMIIVANDILFYSGNLADIKFIETGASAKLNVTYYK